jgi:hypothetical protein
LRSWGATRFRITGTFSTTKRALAGVGECGIAIRVQPRSDAFELAADLRPGDVIEEKHLADLLPGDQVDLEPGRPNPAPTMMIRFGAARRSKLLQRETS